jgi:hypothetical protein
MTLLFVLVFALALAATLLLWVIVSIHQHDKQQKIAKVAQRIIEQDNVAIEARKAYEANINMDWQG